MFPLPSSYQVIPAQCSPPPPGQSCTPVSISPINCSLKDPVLQLFVPRLIRCAVGGHPYSSVCVGVWFALLFFSFCLRIFSSPALLCLSLPRCHSSDSIPPVPASSSSILSSTFPSCLHCTIPYHEQTPFISPQPGQTTKKKIIVLVWLQLCHTRAFPEFRTMEINYWISLVFLIFCNSNRIFLSSFLLKSNDKVHVYPSIQQVKDRNTHWRGQQSITGHTPFTH